MYITRNRDYSRFPNSFLLYLSTISANASLPSPHCISCAVSEREGGREGGRDGREGGREGW